MWRGPAIAVVLFIAAFGAAALATVWPGSPPEPASPSPAEIVARRFLPELNTAPVTLDSFAERNADLRPSQAGTSALGFADRFAAVPAFPTGAPSAGTPFWPDAATAPDTRRPRGNPLLNDAQIASLKNRLKLTSEQEKLWPTVETALRAVAWHRTSDRRNAPVGLDVASLERLKAAAGPLVAKLRPEQKREIETLAHVLGLREFIADL